MNRLTEIGLPWYFKNSGVPPVDKKGKSQSDMTIFEETFLTIGRGRRRKSVEFDWEAVIDEAAVEGESRSDEKFYDAQVDVEEPVTETPAAPEVVAQASLSRRKQQHQESTPRVPLVEFQKQ
ncbi:hypothetical protein Dimus_006058 [Dionaea muscipula]